MYQNILVMTDQFTRFAWAVPTRDQTSSTTARAVWAHEIQPFGCPMRFHYDQGPNFESKWMQELCKLYGVTKSRTTAYHPQGNGLCERWNQTLLSMLRTLEEEKQDQWADFLPELVNAYNNTSHSSTVYALFYLMYRCHARLPINIALGVAESHCWRLGSSASWEIDICLYTGL